MGQDKVEAVERALTILNAFAADKPELTLAELAVATGFYKSTILRLAGSLERFGYLIRRADGTFRLALAIGIDLPASVQSRRRDQARASPPCRGDRRDRVVLCA